MEIEIKRYKDTILRNLDTQIEIEVDMMNRATDPKIVDMQAGIVSRYSTIRHYLKKINVCCTEIDEQQKEIAKINRRIREYNEKKQGV